MCAFILDILSQTSVESISREKLLTLSQKEGSTTLVRSKKLQLHVSVSFVRSFILDSFTCEQQIHFNKHEGKLRYKKATLSTKAFLALTLSANETDL